MDNNRPVALALGCIAAILVIMAGKSCAGEPPKKSGRQSGNVQSTMQNSTKAPPRLIEEPPAPASDSYVVADATEAVTEVQYEVVTDVFGTVVETIPVTEPASGEIPDGTEQETTLSFVDELNEIQKKAVENELSGFNHGTPEEQHQKEIENATFPSDFNIEIK